MRTTLSSRVFTRSASKNIVQLISATTTNTGLNVACRIDDNLCPKGVTDTDTDTEMEMAAIHLTCNDFQGEWNYAISPVSDSG